MLGNPATSNADQVIHWLVSNQTLLLHYLVNIVAAVATLVIGSLIARFAARAVNRLLIAREMDRTVTVFLSSLIRYGIIVLAFISALSRIGVQTASIIAVLGAAGLAVGLALQGSLSNFAAGVLLVIFRPFRVGEFVDLGGISGTVTQIQIFSTTLRTGDNKLIVVPNNKIISGNIINTSREAYRRIDITLGISYEADIDHVKQVLQQVVDQDARIIADKGTTIRLNEMAASSLNFIVRVWVENGQYSAVYFDLMENFKKALDAEQIGLPYPQLDVHLYNK